MSLVNNYRRRVWWAVRPLWLWRLVRLLLRSLWISGLLAVVGWLASALVSVPISMGGWFGFGLVAYLIVFCVLAFWPVRFRPMVGRMDRALGLRDQLGTAYEVSVRGPRNYLEARLLRSASGSLAEAQRKFWRTPVFPWGDLELCVLVAAIVFAVFANFGPLAASLFNGDSVPLPPLGAEPNISLPGLPPELLQQPPPFGTEDGGAGEGLSRTAAQEALDALAEALSSQTITRSAGAALASGQTDQAAEELRELADRAGEISPEARQQLGQALQQAAREIQGAAPEVAQELTDAAQGLQSGDDAAGTEALDDMAQLVEDLQTAQSGGAEGGEGEAGEAGGAGVGSNGGRESQADGTVDDLAGERETIELPDEPMDPNEEGVLMPPSDNARGEGPQRSTPYTQVSPSGTSVEQISDPLSYPWRLRNVVQQYFSPP